MSPCARSKPLAEGFVRPGSSTARKAFNGEWQYILTLAVTGYRSTTVTAITASRELPSGDLKSIGTTVLEDQCGNNNVYQPFIVGEQKYARK